MRKRKTAMYVRKGYPEEEEEEKEERKRKMAI
jgi:hypothetical protein